MAAACLRCGLTTTDGNDIAVQLPTAPLAWPFACPPAANSSLHCDPAIGLWTPPTPVGRVSSSAEGTTDSGFPVAFADDEQGFQATASLLITNTDPCLPMCVQLILHHEARPQNGSPTDAPLLTTFLDYDDGVSGFVGVDQIATQIEANINSDFNSHLQNNSNEIIRFVTLLPGEARTIQTRIFAKWENGTPAGGLQTVTGITANGTSGLPCGP